MVDRFKGDAARPYSRADSDAEALAECREPAGAQFTAAAVAALEAALAPGLAPLRNDDFVGWYLGAWRMSSAP